MRARRVAALRGAGSSAVAVVLAALSHTIGGGEAPPAWLLVACAIAAWPVATLLALVLSGARLRVVGIAGAVGAAQLALHASFSVLGSTPLAVPAASGVHTHTLLPFLSPMTPGAGAMMSTMDAGMLAAHATAALVATIAIAFGEQAVAAVVRWVSARVRRVQDPSPLGITAPRVAARVRAFVDAPRSWAIWRRGPPAYFVSAIPALAF